MLFRLDRETTPQYDPDATEGLECCFPLVQPMFQALDCPCDVATSVLLGARRCTLWPIAAKSVAVMLDNVENQTDDSA